MLDLDFLKGLFSGAFTSVKDRKKIELHKDEGEYILQLIRCCAARYTEEGKVIER